MNSFNPLVTLAYPFLLCLLLWCLLPFTMIAWLLWVDEDSIVGLVQGGGDAICKTREIN